MLTSIGARGDAKRLYQAGFDAYLTKPVRHTQLRECLSAVLGIQRDVKPEHKHELVTKHSIAEDKRRKVRLLLAEDNPVNQKVALRIIEKLGYRADAVANGKEAIKALEMIPYDLVLMDVQMPEMDGIEATRVIRAGNNGVKNQAIPIIAMTAHALKEDRERCLAAGMDYYLTKPIRPQDLADAVERFVGAGLHGGGI